jgi:copper chaperone CopZ
MIHSYEISGMHCQSCVAKLTKALKEIPGIKEATVTLDPPEAVVEMTSHVPLARLQQAVEAEGNYSLKEKLIPSSINAGASAEAADISQSLAPLFIILGYLVGGVVLRASVSGDFSLHSLMSNFMGGFFIVFSLFKMINISGFAEAYTTYDVLAKKSRIYALSYPFIELALGIAYLVSFAPLMVNVVTLVLMTIGSVGVAQALAKKRAIQCACLGTALKLPMTKVTLAEDMIMGLMAALMLIL